MKTLSISHDIKVYFVQASSFPGGIKDAFDSLALKKELEGRTLYGLSRIENQGGIVYRACVEAKDGDEFLKIELPTRIIQSGNYVCETVSDFKSRQSMIFAVFDQLLSHPKLDPQGYCVEWYPTGTDDVVCMVRLTDEQPG